VDEQAFWAERAGELEEYARLVVRVGLNIEDGQDVVVSGAIEHAPLARAIAEVGYAEGARLVEANYNDVYIRRSRAAQAPETVVGWAGSSSRSRHEGGPTRCSASRTSNASGTRSASPSVWTSPTRRRPGRPMWRCWSGARST
jgi:leucyl aminopeptidase (aminopeptidase T)